MNATVAAKPLAKTTTTPPSRSLEKLDKRKSRRNFLLLPSLAPFLNDGTILRKSGAAVSKFTASEVGRPIESRRQKKFDSSIDEGKTCWNPPSILCENPSPSLVLVLQDSRVVRFCARNISEKRTKLNCSPLLAQPKFSPGRSCSPAMVFCFISLLWWFGTVDISSSTVVVTAVCRGA